MALPLEDRQEVLRSRVLSKLAEPFANRRSWRPACRN